MLLILPFLTAFLLRKGYEIFPQKPLKPSIEIETNDTLLYHHSRDAYEILIDDKDLNIDIERAATSSSMTQVESNTKLKSQQSFKEQHVKNKKKKNIAKNRTVKNEEEAPVIENLSPSSWVTLDPSITSDISLKHRELIELYANPLKELPETLDVR